MTQEKDQEPKDDDIINNTDIKKPMTPQEAEQWLFFNGRHPGETETAYEYRVSLQSDILAKRDEIESEQKRRFEKRRQQATYGRSDSLIHRLIGGLPEIKK